MTLRQDATANRIAPHLSPGPAETSAWRAPLRVAIVHDWLTGLRGGEKCLERLCRLFPDSTIHTLLHAPGTCGPVIESMPIRTSPLQQIPGIARHYRKLLPILPWAVSRLDVGQPDLVVSLSHCVAKAVRVPAGVPHVCYCFTPMRYAWDGRAAYLSRWPVGSIKRRMADRLLDGLARWDARTAAGVSRFVAISRTIEGRITRNYGQPSVIVAPPVDTDYYCPAPDLPREDFYLAASALVPYKRIEQAVEACRTLGRKLVVIGSGPELGRLKTLGGDGVRFFGHCPDEVLRDHLRRCRALIFPGEEDFGILPIEALGCGAPVIALNAGGVAETVDATVGQLYDQPDVASLCEAITTFERRPAGSFAPEAAREKALRFSADRFDAGILDVIRDALAGPARHESKVVSEWLMPASR